ncbi:nicotinate-nucleotide--dimethylbenzimidazole phosphoribosyltransferase [Xanthocytophaga flava]|uniref:nicotinate-nucleotide--dimethylbenzimidazole phosphoribosyltransferase n=1 Tax=Xanthocytophaga flava TaxID=3048013 RepID=UPI0028D6CFE3|nr:nicotinate-nucleotide--dimethylbenzimidazole phosphoribosyltransferase [Xanthocytophaga flavus]MDJ1472904.1 nicotinate-nucleotide--dimethylbenzimidazole phosphoribosyltransferase [Xanthocytophaga flavus]
MKQFKIDNTDKRIISQIQDKLNNKTKPIGSLGKLENIVSRVCLIQQTLSPELNNPHILVFAADHGITQENVSKYPSEVTHQMVLNFLQEGAAINVFCRQHDIALKVIDAGINADVYNTPKLIHQKIGKGTRNFAKEPAMTVDECNLAIEMGSTITKQILQKGCNIVGFGEMGIGNTSSAAVLMHKFTNLPLNECVGKGTGLNTEQMQHKLQVLQKAVNHYPDIKDPLETLATFGGFEIAQMCGAMLQAAENKMCLLIDGFIATAALLSACQFYPAILDYCLFCHQSEEHGHKAMLDYLKAEPILNLDLRLGEGTGCALAYPIIQSSVNFMNEMASFQSAGVSTEKTDN